MDYLAKIVCVGSKSEAERKGSLDWLKKETRPDSKHGREVTVDPEFIERFGRAFEDARSLSGLDVDLVDPGTWCLLRPVRRIVARGDPQDHLRKRREVLPPVELDSR